MELDENNPLKLKDYISGLYYSSIKEGTVISFDSGEGSRRREFISATLRYLQNYKGIPTVVLSSTDQTIIKAFLLKIPVAIRDKVLSIGLFQLYLDLLKKTKEITCQLYLSPKYRAYLQCYMSSLRAVETDLIKQLTKLGITVILDRSILSSWLYNECIGKSEKLACSWNELFNISDFRPTCAFFIHSVVPKDIPSVTVQTRLYDADPTINYELRSTLPKLKKLCPMLAQIPEYLPFKEGFAKIMADLDSKLDDSSRSKI